MHKNKYYDLAEGAILLEGFDDCIVGVSESFGEEPRFIYSKKNIVSKLMEDMNEEDEELIKIPTLDHFYDPSSDEDVEAAEKWEVHRIEDSKKQKSKKNRKLNFKRSQIFKI